jgi:hypothetical protein
MIDSRFFAAALVAGVAISGSLILQNPPDARQAAAFAEFRAQVQSYADLLNLAALTTPGQRVSGDPGEIRRRTDALAAAIRTVRAGARQGDIFAPGIAAAFRAAIGTGCQEDYAELLASVTEELESPLPAPAIHARWPMGVPVPTMPPDLLAVLPALPAGLQYRFMNRDLVLIDIDANLIIDFVPDAIPPSTSAGAMRRP